MSYRTLLKPKYLSHKIRVVDSIAVLRTNSDYVDDILECFNQKNKAYYIHFLDGDKWKERESWREKTFIDRYDFQTSYDLFCLSYFKDAIFQWADEFIIISPYDLTNRIDMLLENKQFTMTRLVHRTEKASFQTIAILSHLVREKKDEGRGKSYRIEKLNLKTEMELA